MSQNPHTPRPGDDDAPDFLEMLQQMLSSPEGGPLKDALSQMGIDKLDPAAMNLLAGQISGFFASAPADGIDVSVCADIARKTVSKEGDAVVPDSVKAAVDGAVRVASLWVDSVTIFDSQPTAVHAWSRAEWVEATIHTWADLVRPLAAGVGNAIAEAMTKQLEQFGDGEMPQIPGMPALPPGTSMAAVIGQMQPMLSRMSGSIFGVQFGQAVGTLAGDVVSGTEVGLPLVGHGVVAMLPANVGSFGNGLEIDSNEVLLYLATRECARVRLFADVTWLGPQLVSAVQAYARDIRIDTERIQATIEGMDPTNMEGLQEALSGELFSPEPSPAQQAALRRLETLLALVEGWVDIVADRATRSHLPHSAALGEAVRRRRATGGPAEELFARLVGLQLRPRRMRDAANLFAALENSGGEALRDQAWSNPDTAPDAEDLDDVLAYVDRMVAGGSQDDVDLALEQLLAGAEDGADGGAEKSADGEKENPDEK